MAEKKILDMDDDTTDDEKIEWPNLSNIIDSLGNDGDADGGGNNDDGENSTMVLENPLENFIKKIQNSQEKNKKNHNVSLDLDDFEIESKNSESVQGDNDKDKDFDPGEITDVGEETDTATPEETECSDNDSIAESSSSFVPIINKGKNKYRRRHYNEGGHDSDGTNNGENLGFVVDKIQTMAIIEARKMNEQPYLVYTPHDTTSLYVLKVDPFKSITEPDKDILRPASQLDLNQMLPVNERYRSSKDKEEWATYSIPLVAQLVEDKDGQGAYTQQIIPITLESEKNIWNIELLSKEEFRSYFHRVHLAKLKNINHLAFKTPEPNMDLFDDGNTNILNAPQKRRRYRRRIKTEENGYGNASADLEDGQIVMLSKRNLNHEFDLIDAEVKAAAAAAAEADGQEKASSQTRAIIRRRPGTRGGYRGRRNKTNALETSLAVIRQQQQGINTVPKIRKKRGRPSKKDYQNNINANLFQFSEMDIGMEVEIGQSPKQSPKGSPKESSPKVKKLRRKRKKKIVNPNPEPPAAPTPTASKADNDVNDIEIKKEILDLMSTLDKEGDDFGFMMA